MTVPMPASSHRTGADRSRAFHAQVPRRRRPARAPALAALATLAALALARSQGPPAPAQAQRAPHAAPTIDAVSVGGYEVFGRLPGAGEGPLPVALELRAPDGLLRARATASTGAEGVFEAAFVSGGAAARRAIAIRPGDLLLLRGPDQAEDEGTRLDVPRLTVEADPGADRIAGQAPPGARLSLTTRTPEGRTLSHGVTADADGQWSVAVGDRVDLGPGCHGSVLYASPEGSFFQAAWVLPGLDLALGADTLALRARPGEGLRAELWDAGADWLGGAEGVAWDGTAALVLRNAAGARVPLPAGGRLRVSFELETGAGPPIAPVDLELPPLTATVLPELDQVAGYGRPGARVRVSLAEGTIGREAAVDARGAWRVALGDLADLGLDTRVRVAQLDVPQVHLDALAPRVNLLDPLGAALWGQAAAGEALRLEARSADGALLGRAEGRVDAEGRFALALFAADAGAVPNSDVPGSGGAAVGFAGGAGGGGTVEDAGAMAPEILPLGDGDRLELRIGEAPGWRESYAFHPLDPGVDAARDAVQGRAMPGSAVSVALEGGRAARSVRAGADGRWRADFAGELDIRPGTRVELDLARPDGPGSRMAFPAFRISPQAGGNRVRVEGPPGLAAAIRVERADRTIGSGSCQVGRDACEARVYDEAGRPIELAEGHTVFAESEGAATAVVAVFPLTAHIDRSGRDVVGQVPTGWPVHIDFSHDRESAVPIGSTVQGDENGVYDYELPASQWSLLLPGLLSDSFMPFNDGHLVMARAAVEQLRARVGDAVIRGIAEPGAGLRAVLAEPAPGDPAAPGSALATASGLADADGRFALTLIGTADARPRAPAPGQVLTLDHARGRQRALLPPLAAWRLDASGALAGATRAGLRVRAFHHTSALPGEAPWQAVEALADEAGIFVLPAPPLDPASVHAIEIEALLADGERLGLVLRGDERPGRAWLPILQGR